MELTIEHGTSFIVPAVWVAPRPPGSLDHGPERTAARLRIDVAPEGGWGAFVVTTAGVPLFLGATETEGSPYGLWGHPTAGARFATAQEAAAAAFATTQLDEADPDGP